MDYTGQGITEGGLDPPLDRGPRHEGDQVIRTVDEADRIVGTDTVIDQNDEEISGIRQMKSDCIVFIEILLLLKRSPFNS